MFPCYFIESWSSISCKYHIPFRHFDLFRFPRQDPCCIVSTPIHNALYSSSQSLQFPVHVTTLKKTDFLSSSPPLFTHAPPVPLSPLIKLKRRVSHSPERPGRKISQHRTAPAPGASHSRPPRAHVTVTSSLVDCGRTDGATKESFPLIDGVGESTASCGAA